VGRKKQALTWWNKLKGEFLCFIKFKIEIVIISLNLFSFNNSFFSFWWINLKSNKQVNVVFAILNLKLFPFLLYIFLLQQFRIFPFQVEPSIFTSVDVNGVSEETFWGILLFNIQPNCSAIGKEDFFVGKHSVRLLTPFQRWLPQKKTAVSGSPIYSFLRLNLYL
jgi:hypothetical protein